MTVEIATGWIFVIAMGIAVLLGGFAFIAATWISIKRHPLSLPVMFFGMFGGGLLLSPTVANFSIEGAGFKAKYEKAKTQIKQLNTQVVSLKTKADTAAKFAVNKNTEVKAYQAILEKTAESYKAVSASSNIPQLKFSIAKKDVPANVWSTLQGDFGIPSTESSSDSLTYDFGGLVIKRAPDINLNDKDAWTLNWKKRMELKWAQQPPSSLSNPNR